MAESTDSGTNRKVVAWVHMSIDGYAAAPNDGMEFLNSASIIRALLNSDLVDELRVSVLTSVVGGGPRLFSDDLSPSTWQLAGVTTLSAGAVGLPYRRR